MEENDNNSFKSVENIGKRKGGFGKTVFVSFISGIIGASLVVGTCFGIPEIKEKIIGKEKQEVLENIKQTSSEVNATAVSLTEYSNTAIGVAAKVLPSIVGIEIEYSVNSIFGKSTGTATGSGIIISEDGYILTNNHVVNSTSSNSYYQVSSAGAIKVKLYNDENVYEAKIVGTDDQTDLAVVKIDKTGLKAAEFGNSDSVVVGEFAMAIGNPLGLATSATSGIISAVNREVIAEGQKYNVIQTDAAINSGNSGGALVNSKGQVIGINTLKLSGDGIEGIGFAIPINDTIDVTKELIDHNKVIRPYVGIEGKTIDKQTAERYHLVEGVYVQVVEDFAAAQKAGIRAGDVITEFDGKVVTKVDEIREIKNKHSIGDKIKVKIFRDGEYKELELVLAEEP